MAARQQGRGRRWVVWLGVALLGVVGLGAAAVFSAGPLLRPLVEARVAAALGRPVSIGRLRIAPGRITTITAEDVIVGNPPDFPAEAAPWLARVPRLTLDLDAAAWLREGSWVVPRIALDSPQVEARELEDGRANYMLDLRPPGEAENGQEDDAAREPRIGALQVRDGRARVVIARLAADFELGVATVDAPGGEPRIEAQARGTYAGQPVTARLTGGAVLNLRDAERPWPVRLELENGPTRATLEGTLRDPLGLRGADLALTLEGPDMVRLAPLTGVPFPKTPPFRLTGRVDYAAGRVRFMDAEGRVGNSDIAGGVIVTTGGAKPVVAAELRSRRVDLADLGAFVGAEPGRPSTPGQTPEQRARVERARASPRLLPDSPLNVPRLRAADVRVDYVAERVQGRGIPFDGMTTQLDIRDGVVDVKRLVFPIGGGELSGRFVLTPQEGDAPHARGEIELRRVDFSRLVGEAGVRGSGRLGGVGRIEGTGRSLAEILGRGEGAMTVVMVGGTLSAFLVDLSGLQFGKAVLSALGLPERERVECLVGDFALRRGTLSSSTLMMDTESAVVTGGGRVDLGSERLELRIRTHSKTFSVGTLPAPIQIAGTLRDPSVAPETAEMAARVGAAVGLGVLLPPLALLPTIQLGVGENSQCERLQGRGGGSGGGAGPRRR